MPIEFLKDVTVNGDVNIPEYINHIGDPHTKLGFVANGNFAVFTPYGNGTSAERFRITNGGYVGILNKNPKTALTQKQQGYYNFLKGIMVSQTNINAAEKFFKNAIKFGLSMDHDLAMAKLNLAGIAFTKRRKIEAKRLLSEAQKLDKRNMMAEQIQMMKQQMKKASVPNQHFGQPRGGRRR